MFFAAAGASNYRTGKYLAIVTICRAARYATIAFAADFYGRHLIRILQHPMQYWGWLLLFAAMILGLITGGILINRRLATLSAGGTIALRGSRTPRWPGTPRTPEIPRSS